MIRNEQEYRAALQRIQEDRAFAAQQRAALEAQGLTPEQVERAMQPALAFHAQLAEEVAWYERVRNGDISPIHRLTDLGRLLIALRIASGITQRELAERLGTDESQVSRDERNEYYGVSLSRAQRIVDALGARIVAGVDVPADRRKLVSSR
jgi:DNA-directed RNA polymerase specialized sigma subunit